MRLKSDENTEIQTHSNVMPKQNTFDESNKKREESNKRQILI